MNASEDSTNSELESFREQWRAEVRARNPGAASSRAPGPSLAPTSSRTDDPPLKPVPVKKAVLHDHEDDYIQPQTFDDPAPSISTNTKENGEPGSSKAKEPVSALDHYEKAVEKEAVGSLGDSLRLYRKAFRMDDKVDQEYRKKHFPKAAAAAKPTQTQKQTQTAAGPNSAMTASSTSDAKPQSMADLIASFAAMRIEPAPPEMEGMPEPPCPIARLPDEILVHILRDVAVLDVAAFVRLAQVCKRLAYLVATEDRIWRRVCLGPEFGFGGMHYHWQAQYNWEPLTIEDVLREAEEEINRAGDHNDEAQQEFPPPPLTLAERAERHAAERLADTNTFFTSLYGSSWQRMFRQRPRVRFNGCYISTVNYIRAGQASVHQVTWNSPVHIVTYYRYLRFFRDGTAISLLTTAEPADVVHHLTREALATHAGGAAAHLPSAVMQSGLRGRWRLSPAADNPTASLSEAEGDLLVDTMGVGRYMYRMHLSLRAAGGKAAATRNNKLVWRAFYSYNRLTDDWAEFGLKNDRPFFFSRVRSYGLGE